MGLVLSVYYIFCLLFFNVDPQIINYHIQYNSEFPKSIAMFAFTIYLMVTIIPLFVLSIKRTHLLGILMFLSCLLVQYSFDNILHQYGTFLQHYLVVLFFGY